MSDLAFFRLATADRIVGAERGSSEYQRLVDAGAVELPIADWIAGAVSEHGVHGRERYEAQIDGGEAPRLALAHMLSELGRSAPGWLIRVVALSADLNADQQAVYDAHIAEPGPDNAAAALQVALISTEEGGTP